MCQSNGWVTPVRPWASVAASAREKVPAAVAVPTMRRDNKVVWIDCTAFDALAEACAKHLRKGSRILVGGRLHLSQWTAEDGSPRSRHEVIAQTVEFLDPRPSAAGPEELPAPAQAAAGSARTSAQRRSRADEHEYVQAVA